MGVPILDQTFYNGPLNLKFLVVTNYMDLCFPTPPFLPTDGSPNLLCMSVIVKSKMYLHMKTKYGISIWKRKLEDLRIWSYKCCSESYIMKIDLVLYAFFSNVLHLSQFFGT